MMAYKPTINRIGSKAIMIFMRTVYSLSRYKSMVIKAKNNKKNIIFCEKILIKNIS